MINLDQQLNTDPLYFTKEVVLEDLPKELLELDVNDKDYRLYIEAFNNGNVSKMEVLRKKHIEDSRFAIHLEFITEIENGEDFKTVIEKHQKLISDLGIKSSSEFMRLVESGKNDKAKQYVKELPKNDPNKKALENLARFL